jgi:hypoxanthine phosphoribosyltransferase
MQILFTEAEIQNKLEDIANHINKNTNSTPPVLICVLNGAFMFFSDLAKKVYECEIDFIRVKSYTGITQGQLTITKDIETVIADKDVYIIDDIYDSGNTMNFIINRLKAFGPKSLTPITLFAKENAPENLIYGFKLENETWIYGYGLDGDKGLWRNVPLVLGKYYEVE